MTISCVITTAAIYGALCPLTASGQTSKQAPNYEFAPALVENEDEVQEIFSRCEDSCGTIAIQKAKACHEYLRVARYLSMRGYHRAALLYYDRAGWCVPFSPLIYKERASCYELIGEYDNSNADREMAVRLEKTKFFLPFPQGRSIFQLQEREGPQWVRKIGEREFAMRASATSEISPDQLYLAYQKAKKALHESKYAQAFNNADSILEVDPNNPGAYAILSLVNLRDRKYDEALKLAETAVKLNPICPAWYRIRSQVLEKLGNSERIKEDSDMVRALSAVPKNGCGNDFCWMSPNDDSLDRWE